MSEEAQTELAELKVKHIALTWAYDDLQQRFDQMTPLLLAALADAKVANEGKRVALEGFERQQRMHGEAVAELKRLRSQVFVKDPLPDGRA